MSSNSSEVSTLMSMGFPEEDSRLALQRSGNNIDLAIEMLSNDPNEDDAEFDLLPENADNGVNLPTVFQPRVDHGNEPDAFLEGSTTIEEMVDSRIQSLTAMGFTVEQAQQALRAANNDINEALNLLLSSA